MQFKDRTDIWSEHELEYLKTNYTTASMEEIQTNLPKRNIAAIRTKASVLRLHRYSAYDKKPRKWSGIKQPSKKLGWQEAERLYPCPIGTERHHKDGDPTNNDPSNIEFISHKGHMQKDGRLELFNQNRPVWIKSEGTGNDVAECSITRIPQYEER